MSSLPYSPATPRPIPSHLNQGSSPRQIEPNSIPRPADRWHPKITVYRLMIVLLGFGLGTAKAWATWRGETILSITLEWISAVVISLILFILSWYDNLDDAPTPVPFLFSYDCLDIIWRILYIPKPAYRSDECSHIVPPITDTYPYRPLITGYRILVSSIMAAFGLSKMICSYMGLNTAATAIEWVTACIVGTSLYLLGLYEGNTCNVLPILFTTDYSGAVEAAFYVVLSLAAYVSVTAACIFWTGYWFGLSLKYIITPIALAISSKAKMALGPSSVEVIHEYTLKLVTSSILLFLLLLPIPLLLFLFCNSKLYPLLRHGLLFVDQKMWSDDSRPSRDRTIALGITLAKKVGYVALHIFTIAFCTLVGIVLLGMAIRIGLASSW